MIMQTMWVVSPDYPYEGLGNPVGIFDTLEQGNAFIEHEIEKARKAHRARPDYDISQAYVNPSTLHDVDAEDLRQYEERQA